MSTQLGIINKNVIVTRFYGGDEQGVSIQLTSQSRNDGHVQLSASEIVALIPMLKIVLDDELNRKKRECEKVIEENKELMKTIVKDMRDVAGMAINAPIFEMASLLTLGKAEVTDSEVQS